MTELILLRHGQSVANAENRLAGHSDYDLTDLGRKQAELAGEYLAAHYPPDVIYASDLLRAYNTALPTSRLTGVPIIPDEGLREIYAGAWEGMLWEEAVERYPKEIELWKTDFSAMYCPEGESVTDLYRRFCPHLLKIARRHEGKRVLIGTHNIPIRTFLALAMGCDEFQVGQTKSVWNASISRFAVEDGRVTLLEENFSEYLLPLQH